MLRNVIYYWLKPFVPRAIRMAVRRFLAQHKRGFVGNVWPILPGSEKPPEGWKGWPDGKKFAVVLTHDVEGQKGLDRVRALAEVEMELGFRSSFNFIPEGSYAVSKELRDWLTSNGFEVGVHDLHHDGKLYRSREQFSRCAKRINHYLKEWGAVGFRSGFMLHNLEWIHELNIEYDASTFDTDPFEPQPDHAGTIFPFWVQRPAASDASSREGYVELPYTLVQDSTLFLVLQERGIELWKTKLAWLAEKGGMALVNVHPDYINFKESVPSDGEFPLDYYRALLEQIRALDLATYWQPLPHEAAAFYKKRMAPGPTGPR